MSLKRPSVKSTTIWLEASPTSLIKRIVPAGIAAQSGMMSTSPLCRLIPTALDGSKVMVAWPWTNPMEAIPAASNVLTLLNSPLL